MRATVGRAGVAQQHKEPLRTLLFAVAEVVLIHARAAVGHVVVVEEPDVIQVAQQSVWRH